MPVHELYKKNSFPRTMLGLLPFFISRSPSVIDPFQKGVNESSGRKMKQIMKKSYSKNLFNQFFPFTHTHSLFLSSLCSFAMCQSIDECRCQYASFINSPFGCLQLSYHLKKSSQLMQLSLAINAKQMLCSIFGALLQFNNLFESSLQWFSNRYDIFERSHFSLLRVI